MQNLPITELFPDLRQLLKLHSQILIQAPTGSGKSTALPAEMLDWPELEGKILMLEPRRVATRSIAQFVATQRNTKIGGEVGYCVRGESRISKNTRLEIVTEGILTRMIQADPELSGINTIIFDEVHERHLTTDLGLALALETQFGFREDLNLILMSATLDKASVSNILPNAVELQSEGRTYPVSIQYHAVKDRKQYISTMRSCISDAINDDNLEGDILAFLPGKAEILRLQNELASYLPTNCICTPLYGSLSSAEQDKALKPISDRRKIILATNIAESSLTIDGVRIVIDSGLKKLASYNPKTGITRLTTHNISQASATQRAGRAGRQAAGHCIRIWRKEDHERRDEFDDPEITQAELVDFALNSAVWGAKSINELPLLTAAPKANEQTAWTLLKQLEYIDENRKLTPLGAQAYQIGATPRIAHMLLKAQKQLSLENLALACCLAAIVESHNLPRKGCDIQNYLAIALQGACKQQAERFAKLTHCSVDLSKVTNQAHWQDIGLLLALAFPDRIAQKRSSGSYLLANGTGVELPLEDPLNACEYIVIADLQESQYSNNAQVFLASQLDPRLFEEQLAFLASTHAIADWDSQNERFKAEQQRRLGSIVLSRRTIAQPDTVLVIKALLEQVSKQGLNLLDWNHNAQQLQLKIALAKKYNTQYDWPDFTHRALLENINTWLSPYLVGIKSLKQLRQLNISDILRSNLSWEQQQWIDSELPDKWLMATGTKAPIRYTEDGRALISVRLQEALGMTLSPKLANNNINVTMELLSPARRPIATTADLASFWSGPYHQLKKEMRGRYPKHLWPDNPLNTEATKFTKKKAGL
ncbi:ATP-dependent helicase HrpB [Shewanella sp. OPT22]|nr:ATP-dependent helicase HrpB [Shewanella sp. OPT22]